MSETTFPPKVRPFLGHAVANGLLRYSSISQVDLFAPFSGGCNRRWFGVYVGGLKEKKTEKQKGGSNDMEKLEHYLRTGEMGLSPNLQLSLKYLPKPGPDLDVEKPFGIDIEKAVKLHDLILSKPNATNKDAALAEMKRLAGLVVADVPFDGAADWRHTRQEYKDKEGVLRKEHTSTWVAALGDLKMTSQIDSRKNHKTGKISPGYAKTDAGVIETIQMVLEGVHAADLYPQATHIRQEYIYCSTGVKGAVIRGGLVPVEQVRARSLPIADEVFKMKQVATLADLKYSNDVDPNIQACHRYNKPCHLLATPYCRLDQEQVQVTMSLTRSSVQGVTGMSLLDKATDPNATIDSPPPPPPAPALSAEEHAAAVSRERELLHAEMSPPPPVKETATALVNRLFGPEKVPDAPSRFAGVGCGATGCGVDCPPGRIKQESGMVVACVSCGGLGAKPRQEGGLLPPDAPMPTFVTSAKPLTAEAIADITNPALLERVQLHAQMSKEQQVSEEKAKPVKESPWCAYSGTVLDVTLEIMVAQRGKPKCPTCGFADRKIKPAPGDKTFEYPKHKPKGVAEGKDVEGGGSSVAGNEEPPPPPPPTYRAPDALVGQTAMAVVVPPEPVIDYSMSQEEPPPPPPPVASIPVGVWNGRRYPLSRSANESRFTLSLALDVAQALAKHGYPTIENGADVAALQQALHAFLYS